MEFIVLIVISIWLISKMFGRASSNNKVGFNEIEKHKTFESFRKK